MREFNDLIRRWRARALMTQEELAERTGLSARTIRRLESGELHKPRPSSLDQIVRVLGLSERERAMLVAVSAGNADRYKDDAPAQLPLPPASFVGRHEELERITESFERHRVTVVAGIGGVGKSALVVHAAHLMADHFHDGQLYVDLYGHRVGVRTLDTIEVLGRFLRALGHEPSAVPTGVDEAAALYRTTLATRCILIVLDNAADAAQVRTLLPGDGRCRVLVTSRRPMATLDACHLALDVMPESEAVELLGVCAGQSRVASDPESARAIADLCDRLPLALRIAGAYLSADPGLSLASLRHRLAAERTRLDLLEIDDLAVRMAFQASYEELDGSASETFRRLGLLKVADFGPAGAAALMDTSPALAQITLDRFVNIQLVDRTGDRYRLHDLLRLFAAERSEQHDHKEEAAHALTRALTCYLGAVRRASDLIRPDQNRAGDDDLADPRYASLIPLSNAAEATRWVELELGNLMALARHTADSPDPLCRFALRVAGPLRMFLPLRGYLGEWQDLTHLSLGVARRVADLPAQAVALMDLGAIAQRIDRLENALSYLNDALAIAGIAGSLTTEAAVYSYLASTHTSRRDTSNALFSMRRAVELRRQIGQPGNLGVTLGNCALYSLALGQISDAASFVEESIEMAIQAGDGQSEGVNNVTAAGIYLAQDRLDDAMTAVQVGLDLCRDYGNRYHEWIALVLRAEINRRVGLTDESVSQLLQALELCHLHGEHAGAAIASRLLQRLGAHADEQTDRQLPVAARTRTPSWLLLAVGIDA